MEVSTVRWRTGWSERAGAFKLVVSVYMDANATTEEIEAAGAFLRHADGVVSVSYLSKEASLDRGRGLVGDQAPLTLENVPTVFECVVSDPTAGQALVGAVRAELPSIYHAVLLPISDASPSS